MRGRNEGMEGHAAPEGDDGGQGLVEYASILAFVAVVVIVALMTLRDRVGLIFSLVGTSLQ